MDLPLVVLRNLDSVLFTLGLKTRILWRQILLGDELAVIFDFGREVLLDMQRPWRFPLLRQILFDFFVIRALVARFIRISAVFIDLFAAHQIILGAGDGILNRGLAVDEAGRLGLMVES